jgi:hypothetical protein
MTDAGDERRRICEERLKASLQREQQLHDDNERLRAEVSRLKAVSVESALGPHTEAVDKAMFDFHRRRGEVLFTQLTELREATLALLQQIDVTDDAEAFDEAIANARAVLTKVTPRVEVNERGHYVVPSDIDVNARLDELAKGKR